MQKLYFAKEELYGRKEVIEAVTSIKESTEDYKCIDIGATHNPFSLDLVTHTFDFRNPNLPNVHTFTGNINDYEDWKQIFDYVEEHGKFDFCNCTHTLEDVAYPEAALKYMPRIAKRGFIAVPSKYYELQRRTLFRGAVHHRWIFDIRDDVLWGWPKINLIDYINNFDDNIINQKGDLEIRMFWEDEIEYKIINGDYLGPTFEHVLNMYCELA